MSFHSAVPDGTNETLASAISADGRPLLHTLYRVPARNGVAVRLSAGQVLEVQNTTGRQVCDFWAFCEPDHTEFLSMAHCRTALLRIFPKVGDTLVSNKRTPMLTIVEDSSPGVHDTLMSCCDAHRYRLLGCEEYHDNCTDNLRMAFMAIGFQAPAVPDPFNLWMNIPVTPQGEVSFEPTISRKMDVVRLLALTDVLAVMSACPQDMNPINGKDCIPSDVHFQVHAE